MTDAEKFAETMTLFAVAAVENNDSRTLQLCVEGLNAHQKGNLDQRTIEAISQDYGLKRFASFTKTNQLRLGD